MGCIRLLLALAVVLGHFEGLGVRIMPPTVAVQAFFIISGFYMSLILNGKYGDTPLRVFYVNRMARILPSLFLVTLATAVSLYGFHVGASVTPEQFTDSLTSHFFTAMAVLAANLTGFGQEAICFFGMDPDGYFLFPALSWDAPLPAWKFLLVPQGWSISMEFLFYLVAPFVLRARIGLAGSLLLLSLLLRVIFFAKGYHHDLWLRRFFPSELCIFLMGYFGYLVYQKLRDVTLPAWLCRTVWLFTICCISLYAFFPLHTVVVKIVVLIGIAASIPFIFQHTKDSAIDRFIGDLSYPLYLTHILGMALGEKISPSFPFLTGLVITFLGSLSLVLVVEKPIDAWRQKRLERKKKHGEPVRKITDSEPNEHLPVR